MAFKSYFDGGNKADSTQYKIVTLAALSGTTIVWADFERRWKRILADHGAPFLHTSDAVSLNKPFAKEDGWTKEKVDHLVTDCVSAMKACAAVRRESMLTYCYYGLRPVTVSVVLGDYKRASREIPLLHTSAPVEQICAIEAAVACTYYGHIGKSEKYQFFLDQNEPFYGHLRDRKDNKKSKAIAPFWDKVSLAEADMRNVPALQAADLLAWSLNNYWNERKFTRVWQEALLTIERDAMVFDYDKLRNLDMDNLERIQSFNLPRRKQLR